MMWDIPWGSQGQLSLLCPFSTPFAPTASSLVGWGEEQKRPWFCLSSALQSKSHDFVLSCIYKHSSTLASRKKISFIPIKSYVLRYENWASKYWSRQAQMREILFHHVIPIPKGFSEMKIYLQGKVNPF